MQFYEIKQTLKVFVKGLLEVCFCMGLKKIDKLATPSKCGPEGS